MGAVLTSIMVTPITWRELCWINNWVKIHLDLDVMSEVTDRKVCCFCCYCWWYLCFECFPCFVCLPLEYSYTKDAVVPVVVAHFKAFVDLLLLCIKSYITGPRKLVWLLLTVSCLTCCQDLLQYWPIISLQECKSKYNCNYKMQPILLDMKFQVIPFDSIKGTMLI